MMRAMSGVMAGGTHSARGLHGLESLPWKFSRANFTRSLVTAVTGFPKKIKVF